MCSQLGNTILHLNHTDQRAGNSLGPDKNADVESKVYYRAEVPQGSSDLQRYAN